MIMKMIKNITRTIALLLVLASCQDMIHVDSSRYITDSEYTETANDSLYSTFGILSQLQKLGDSYVLLGELRADLLDVTDISDIDLKEINSFNVSSGNKYARVDDYYAVINNCNFVLKQLDTAFVDQGKQLDLRQFAAIKSIRAWTYMQLAQNFGKVKYNTEPILTIKDASKTYPEYTMDELAELLVQDLLPLKDVPFPSIGYIGSYNISNSYFPIRFLLGDLYLWKGEYENAAREYYDLIFEKGYLVSRGNSNTWQTVNNNIGTTANLNWNNVYVSGNSEMITTLNCPTQYGQKLDLDTLNKLHKIVPSQIALKTWNDQTYFQSEASSGNGDLRKFGSVWWKKEVDANSYKNNTYLKNDQEYSPYFVFKYLNFGQRIPVYRSALLYLRYAEALNRLHKPMSAFAILKHGLNSTTIYDKKIIPESEMDSAAADYMNFGSSKFYNNVGLHMRGSGNTNQDTTFYRFPALATMQDSVLFVENKIVDELALETAFEGNRFQDLMRIAYRRIREGEGDESYLADKIAAKHTGRETEVKALLMNSDNWYIKH